VCVVSFMRDVVAWNAVGSGADDIDSAKSAGDDLVAD